MRTKMRARTALGGLCLAVLGLHHPALADAQNGFGVGLGYVSASEGGAASRGVDISGNAQFVFNRRWSLVPYLQISHEAAPLNESVSDALAGLEVRRWFGDFYVGVHAFAHDRVVFLGHTAIGSAYGPAGGVLGGVEWPDGFGLEALADLHESTSEQGVYRNAVVVNLTYRWR